MPRKVRLEGLRLEVPRHPDPNIPREYELISPLWGGGERPNRRDSVTGIRPSSIKGQLRFWWRAVRGWRAGGSLKKLLELEEKIWGGVTKVKQSSRVRIEVELIEPNELEKIKHLSAHEVPRYAAFPLFQGEDEDREKALSEEGIRFRLNIWLDPLDDEEISLKDEVEAALWAWETFGGIGARTRRGFGAVALSGAGEPASAQEIKNKLRGFGALDSKDWPKGVPHLTESSPIAVLDKSWQEVIELYQRFRQYRPEIKKVIHKSDGRKVIIPGRSKWPEPPLIRWAYFPSREKKPEVLVAPRALFGLPVPFPFLKSKGKRVALTGARKDEREDAGIDRLASPLILRPLNKQAVRSESGGKSRPTEGRSEARAARTLVAVLEGERIPPGGVHLHPQPQAGELKASGIRVELDAETAQKLVESGLRVLEVGGRVYSDPVRAFWECLQDDACVGLLNKVDLGR